METRTQLFSALVGPLKYACRQDFAFLGTVKDLRGLVAHAARSAQAAGLEQLAKRLDRESENADHPLMSERKGALERIVESLREAGVSLPPELAAVGRGEARGLGPPGSSTAGLPLFLEKDVVAPGREVEGLPSPARRRSVSRPREKGSAAAPARGKSKRAAERTEAEGEARLLSIAPREGPLAQSLKQLGWRLNPRLLGLLSKKGVQKVGDVLFLLPRVYEDRRRMKRIAELVPGERGVTVGEVKVAGEVRSGRRCFRAVIADSSGSIAATYFQPGPWLKAKFPIGRRVVVSGEVRASPYGREIPHPEVEPADDLTTSSVHFNRIVPVYPGLERHEQRQFRELAFRVAEQYAGCVDEPLPEELRERLGLLGLAEALSLIHFPADRADLRELDDHRSAAHRRLAFDELFFLQLGMALKRKGVKLLPGVAFEVSSARVSAATDLLPFHLTSAQERVAKELAEDMGRPEPMNRLLQGDVGSGKTAMAVFAAALAVQDGYQVAVMAPTEILAEQHHRTFRRLFAKWETEVGLFTSGGTAKARRELRAGAASGRVKIAVGTHALIEDAVEFARLGLVVIDEQHRFGVMQRHALMAKGTRPDVLVMTATPIPRTLAMSLYGDLEVSVIDELPPGRTPIITRLCVEKSRPKVYERMRAQLARGHQCYVVYPLVDESEKVDLADATRGATELRQLFPEHEVGLLHGRMKTEEKEEVMARFRDRRVQILVCTTVVEVGVDVPNASVMVIEAAERFGLSQLHQLRGRVGRGAAESHCFLVAGYARSKESTDRLKVMEESSDGFVIAERDLELRGPGEFLGTRQSGVPELAVANLARDQLLLSRARDEARRIVDRDPHLALPEHAALVRALEERWQGRLALARVG